MIVVKSLFSLFVAFAAITVTVLLTKISDKPMKEWNVIDILVFVTLLTLTLAIASVIVCLIWGIVHFAWWVWVLLIVTIIFVLIEVAECSSRW